METISLAQSDEDVLACFDVMHQLRPHLLKEEFVGIIREMMAGGYQLAFIKEGGLVVSVAGFRVARSLWMGKHLYVDDLVSDQNTRSRGHGDALVAWLTDLAKSQGCRFLHLDSGVQRADAHRFYMKQGMSISCFHFQKSLED